MGSFVCKVIGALPVLLVVTAVQVTTVDAKRFETDVAFGDRGLVTGKVGPIDKSSTLGPRILATDQYGRAIIGGASGGKWFVWRLLPDGSRDSSFGDQGQVVITEWGYVDWEGAAVLTSAVIRPDGRILLAGYVGSYPSGLIRMDDAWFVMKQLMPDGSPDSTFGRGGGRSFGHRRGAVDLALRPDGGFLVAAFKQLRQTGRTDDAALYSFEADGKVVRDFGPGENVDSVNVLGAPRKASYFFDVDLLPDGRMLVCGTKRNRLLLMRLHGDGSRDRSFGRGGQVSWLPKRTVWASARDMEVDRKGRIVLTGSTDPVEPTDAAYGVLLRFKRDGQVDRSFGSSGVARLYATARSGVDRRTSLFDVTIDSAGGIWVTGSAGRAERGDRKAVAVRYLANGSKDRKFFRKGVLKFRLGDGSVGTSSLRAGRKIYVSGRFDRGNQERFFLKRLRPR